VWAYDVFAELAGVQINPTADVGVMAFMQNGADPGSGDWKTAIWDTDTTKTPTQYDLGCLVGPGGTITLAPGRYRVWVKVTDSPEIPVLEVDDLIVK